MARGRARGRGRGRGRGRRAARGVISSDDEQQENTKESQVEQQEEVEKSVKEEEKMEVEEPQKATETPTTEEIPAVTEDARQVVQQQQTFDMEADISQLEAPTFTTLTRGPPEPMLRLEWNHRVNLIGEKVLNPVIYLCDLCEKPILVYGRMIPCKHVFCLKCARNETSKSCPRCKEKAIRVEQAALGTIYMCTHGGTRYESKGCRRTYLSQRDLQAHINHRHVTAPAVARLESLAVKITDPVDPVKGGGLSTTLSTNKTSTPTVLPESASSKFFSPSTASSFYNTPPPTYGGGGSQGSSTSRVPTAASSSPYFSMPFSASQNLTSTSDNSASQQFTQQWNQSQSQYR